MGVCVGKIFDWLATVCVRLFACWQVVPDSDAHRAGLQEGDQVLSVNDVDFQDIEHSRVRPSCDCTKQFHTVLFFCHIFVEDLTPVYMNVFLLFRQLIF